MCQGYGQLTHLWNLCSSNTQIQIEQSSEQVNVDRNQFVEFYNFRIGFLIERWKLISRFALDQGPPSLTLFVTDTLDSIYRKQSQVNLFLLV